MVDVKVTRIASKLKQIVKQRALRQLVKTFVICRKYMDHVLAIIQCGITILIEIHAHNSSMAVVLAMPIVSRKLRIVRHSVQLMIKSVSITHKGVIYIRISIIIVHLCSAACDQPIESGPCNGSFERWSYDKERDSCVPFNFGGCKGNKNNFATSGACEHHCKKPGIGKSEYTVNELYHNYYDFKCSCHLLILFCLEIFLFGK